MTPKTGSNSMALLLATALSLGCTKTATSTTEVPLNTQTRLVRAPNAESTLDGDWKAAGIVVSGQVKWATGCQRQTTRTVVVVEKKETSPAVAENVLWMLAGAGMSAGGGYLLAEAPHQSSAKGCSDDSCSSPKEKFQIGGTTLLIAGAVGLVWGGVGLASGSSIAERRSIPATRDSTDPGRIACGDPKQLEGTVVKLAGPGLPDLTATVDAEGKARFEMPELAGLDTSKAFPVVIAKAPSGASLIEEGTEAGKVDLDPYAEWLRGRRGARLAEADQVEFEGVLHGDSAARGAFTVACVPSGKDVCFDAIDNDCDGEYDVGCGYQSGALQWTLAWKTGDDLDLHVVGPDNAHVFFGHRQGGPAGLALDVDCLGQFGANCLAQNVENIFTPRDKKPMEGTYRGWVQVFRAVEDESEAGRVVEAMLGGRLAGKTFRMPLRLQAQNGVRVFFAFAIGKDRDKDSVIDRQDACPDEPGVFSPYAAEQGCPDRDLDGVADRLDACPDEAGLRNPDRKKNGCPRKFGKARLTAQGVEIDGAIHFATGSAAILAESFGLLKDVASVMREVPQAVRVVRIEGHTDSQGERDKNMRLSRERVKSVFEHMIKKERIAASRLRFNWFGPDRPVADNATDGGRAKNRRVEFHVVEPEPTTPSAW
jgi:outer membrane protein OmpA-like peptidoglycan-associated protein